MSMEIFGILTFTGEVQNIDTKYAQMGGEPFVVREIGIHTFSVGTQNNVLTPYMRGIMMRLTGRSAQTFNIPMGAFVAVEYGSSMRVYQDHNSQLLRLNGNLTVNRIVEVTPQDLDNVQRLMQSYVSGNMQ